MGYCVYCLTLPNGKKYIGQTGRKAEERWCCGYGYRDNPVLFEDIMKFGWDNVDKKILSIVSTREEALSMEKAFINNYNTLEPNGYNRVRVNEERLNCVSIETKLSDDVLINPIAFLDFKATEGMKMKVFIHCILVSERSNPDTGNDGNVFKVQRVVKSIRKEMPEISGAAVRMNISRLLKDGFVIRTDVRGEYFINPKYGIKGTITEKTYLQLTIERQPCKGE